MKYLLDTNTCIFIINFRPAAVRRKLEAQAVGNVAISTVTVSELEYGAAKSQHREKNRATLEKFLLPLEVLVYDAAAARGYGEIRAHLEKDGTPIGPMDLMIAAHALATGLTVVTNNTREFRRVPSLQVEDWTEPGSQNVP